MTRVTVTPRLVTLVRLAVHSAASMEEASRTRRQGPFGPLCAGAGRRNPDQDGWMPTYMGVER